MAKKTQDSKTEKGWRQATRLVRGGTRRSGFDENAEALFLTSSYVYDNAEEAQATFAGETDHFIYSRYGNPTVDMFETRLKLLEGAEHCFATATGMAAVHASLASFLKTGDRVVSARALFGSCHHIVDKILPRFGIETEFVDNTDYDAWEKALSKPAAAVFLETPSNPTLELIDLKRIADLAHKAGAKLIVDNVFATPVLQKPFEFGADIVVYSATKHIDGQGRTMGGAILTNDTDYFDDHLIPFVRNTGPSLSPFNAWVLLKGLETIDLRVTRMAENADKVARHLDGKKGIGRVIYPGLKSHPGHDLVKTQMNGSGGTLVSFEIEGGKDAAFKVVNALDLIDISNNLGDSKSLITHPATTTHFRLSDEERTAMGISDALVRLSVGLEDADDLIDDLDRALG